MANDQYAIEIIPEEIASLVDWVKATEGLFTLRRGDCPSPSRNAKQKSPDEATYMLHMQTVWDWLYDNCDTRLLNMPLPRLL